MQTCTCNEDPLTPHFYIVKLEFTGVYIFSYFFAQNIDCGYLLELYEAVLTCTHNQCFEQKNKKNNNFSSENHRFLKNSSILHGHVFVIIACLV